MELDDDVLRYYVGSLPVEPCSVSPVWYVARYAHRHPSAQHFEVIAQRHPDEAVRHWAADVARILGEGNQMELGPMHLTAAERREVSAELAEITAEITLSELDDQPE